MYEKMTDEEIFALIEEQYGKDWKPEDLDPSSELCEEYIRRVTQGF